GSCLSWALSWGHRSGWDKASPPLPAEASVGLRRSWSLNSAWQLCLREALLTFLSPRPDLCEYGDACTKAHSAQELQEWVQSAQAAELRGQSAWQDGLVSYQERLLAEYQCSSSEVLVLAETLEGVRVTCSQPLRHQAQERKTQYSWTFAVHSESSATAAWPWTPSRQPTIGRGCTTFSMRRRQLSSSWWPSELGLGAVGVAGAWTCSRAGGWGP
uniref:Uncharacterized protein n=1 Tax=Callithrix jacchus TaxID=9483 RepID=A0A8I4A053_CALJA